MPQRPREHQLETESRNAFEALVTSQNWVYRPLSNDYGVDGEVEIFCKSYATGLKFLVQLKATDSPLDRSINIRLSKELFAYYSSLGLPVLLVKYLASKKNTYIRWHHSYDEVFDRYSKKSITFNFSGKDILVKGKVHRFSEDVSSYMELRGSHLSHPITFDVFIEDIVHGVPRHELESELERAQQMLYGLLKFNFTDKENELGPNTILITNSMYRVCLARAPGITYHTPEGLQNVVSSKFVSDILLNVALSLDKYNHPNDGASIITKFVFSSSRPEHFSTSISLALCLARAKKYRCALELSVDLLEKELDDLDMLVHSVQSYLMPFLLSQPLVSKRDKEFAIQVMEKIAEIASNRKHKKLAATLHYNMAGVLRGLDEFKKAIRKYRTACELYPDYWDREYFLREIAGTLFMLGRYKLSAKIYKIALDTKNTQLCKCLYADSLLFSGEYDEADKMFEQGVNRDSQLDAEWQLKRLVIKAVTSVLKKGRQDRSPSLAKQHIGEKYVDYEDDERLRQDAKNQLKADGLYALAWFNLGKLEVRAGREDNAMMCFLTSALISRTDYESWYHSIILSLRQQQVKLLLRILVAAYLINREELVGYISKKIKEEINDDAAKDCSKMLRQIINDIPKESEIIKFRSHLPGGWDQLVVNLGEKTISHEQIRRRIKKKR